MTKLSLTIVLMSVILSIIAISSSQVKESFAQKLDDIFVSESCGISIEYPKKWVAKESNFPSDIAKTIVTITPNEKSLSTITIELYDISTLPDKTIEGIIQFEENFLKSSYDDYTLLESTQTKISGFPAQKLSYSIGHPEEYEFQEDESHYLEFNIIAHDIEYKLKLETESEKKFNKYSSIFDEMVETFKISKPGFQGIDC